MSNNLTSNQFSNNVIPLRDSPKYLGLNRQTANQKLPYAELSDYQINALDSTYRWTNSWTNPTPITLTYSFFTTGSTYYGTETASELTTAIKNNVRTVLENIIEPLVNIDFQEVSDSTASYGKMRFMFSNGPGYAYAYYPSSSYALGGDVHFSPNYQNDSLNSVAGAPGTYGFSTIIHETSHALGLKHPGNYDAGSGSGSGPFLPYAEDNDNNTVMTYNSYIGNNSPATLMPYDIKALQYIYGAKAKNSGDTTYSFSSVYGYTAGGETWGSASTKMKLTVFDSGGIDTFNFSSLTFNGSGYRFDLGENGFITEQTAYNSSSYDPYENPSAGFFPATKYGTKIAYNTAIENLVNSSSNDQIILNSGANIISGYTTNGSTGQDIIESSNNLDKLDLSAFGSPSVSQTQTGNNLVLGLGNQRTITIKDYYLANANERINIQFGPITGDDNDNLLNGTSDNDTINGLGGNDTLDGLAGSDSLDGGTGNDIIRGSDGIDTLIGNDGNDYLAGNDQDDSLMGDNGNDTLYGGYDNDTVDGGAGNDQVYGNSGRDSLIGGEGNDVLDGGTWKDTMVGGEGNDVYWVDDTADVIIETSTTTTEIDGVRATTSYSLSGNLEYLILEGTSDIFGQGDAQKNTITGNIGNNFITGGDSRDILTGNDGNDRLRGDAGSDSLNGGNGNDTLIGYAAASEKDTYTGGAGNDVFFLGNSSAVFYNGDGNNGYATITDLATGDKIQLKGNSSNYTLITNQNFVGTTALDTAIATTSGDVIGVVQDNTSLITSVSSSFFTYV